MRLPLALTRLALAVTTITTTTHAAPTGTPTPATSPASPASTSHSTPTPTGARSCNGDPSLCSRRYSDVTFIGAHNSYSNGTSLSSDQTLPVETQLRDGIRLLQGQGHRYESLIGDDNDPANPSRIHLCHTSCLLLDGGTLESYLSRVKAWLDNAANRNEVLTLLFTNPEGQNITQWDAAVRSIPGLADVAYIPPHARMRRGDWPTLGDMIESNKRIVFFIDRGADTRRVPYFLDEFSQMYENPYDQTSLPFNCSRDRGTDDDTLYLHNHTKDVAVVGITVPETSALSTVNSANGTDGIVETVRRCQKENRGNVRPTFVLVDFYDQPRESGVFEAARILNGLPARGGGAAEKSMAGARARAGE